MNDAQLATLKRLEARIAELPILPAVVTKLMQLDPNEERYFERVVACINSDPAFATRLLQYANSAAMASPKPITSIGGGLLRVGVRGAVELILAHSATRIFLPRQGWERGLWVHAIMVAWLMRRLSPLATLDRIDPDSAYLFGLLHDIGRFVLYLEAPEDLRAVDETDWEDPAALVRAEVSICGFTHAELGFLALRKWHLPDALALAVRDHHTTPFPPPGFPAEYVSITQLLQDADWIAVVAARQGLAFCKPPAAEFKAMLDRRLRLRYRQTTEELIVVIDDALREAARSLAMLRLPVQ